MWRSRGGMRIARAVKNPRPDRRSGRGARGYCISRSSRTDEKAEGFEAIVAGFDDLPCAPVLEARDEYPPKSRWGWFDRTHWSALQLGWAVRGAENRHLMTLRTSDSGLCSERRSTRVGPAC